MRAAILAIVLSLWPAFGAGAFEAEETRFFPASGPGAREVAAELHVDLDEYHQLLLDASGHRVFSLDDGDEGMDPMVERVADPHAGITERMEDDEFQRALAAAISQKPFAQGWPCYCKPQRAPAAGASRVRVVGGG
jgi:hypothetical protein